MSSALGVPIKPQGESQIQNKEIAAKGGLGGRKENEERGNTGREETNTLLGERIPKEWQLTRGKKKPGKNNQGPKKGSPLGSDKPCVGWCQTAKGRVRETMGNRLVRSQGPAQ